jgi:secreted PhoX family phosphatase
MTMLDRRSFLKRAGTVTAGAVVMSTGVEAVTRRLAAASPLDPSRAASNRASVRKGYGELEPRPPINGGVAWLALPAHFQYAVLSRIGDPMSDGTITPRSCDGMGAFADGPHGVRLVRNHEIRFLGSGATNSQGQYVVGRELGGGLRNYPGTYDPMARGGNTTIRFDRRAFHRTGGNIEDFVSNVGSVVNCAGGVHPGLNAWFTCEEIVQEPGNPTGSPEAQTQPHGYAYPVPAGLSLAQAPATPQPVVEMGRFAHEAVAVDPATGIIFETEDAGSRQGSGFYRFLPNNPLNPYAGGTLQILGVADPPNATRDMRDGFPAGTTFQAVWINITEPNPAGSNVNSVFEEGYANGAALFNRLEGVFYADRSIFFVSTSGGNVKNGDDNTLPADEAGREYEEGYGQIWEYHLDDGLLELLYESPGGSVLDSPDNMAVSPRGGIVLCEDDSSDGNHVQPGEDPNFDVSPYHGGSRNRLIGLTLEGDAFPLAENILNEAELAGACWSPDGEFLFCNIFGDDVAGSGGTLAITGPWHKGSL